MGRKGEERERWTGRGGPPAKQAAPGRPGDDAGWLEPGLHAWGEPRRDPFARRPPLGPKGYRRPDDRILEEVCERIGRSGLDAREVEVAVAQGEVTLSGTVLGREDKRALEDIVDDVFGVEDVHNQLRLAGRARATRPRRPGGGRKRGRDPHGKH